MTQTNSAPGERRITFQQPERGLDPRLNFLPRAVTRNCSRPPLKKAGSVFPKFYLNIFWDLHLNLLLWIIRVITI